jgi:hypothetical protein
MRQQIIVVAAVCSVLSLGACKPGPDKSAAAGAPAAAPSPAPAMMAGPPQVRAGLWEMAMDVKGAPKGLSAKSCIDPAVQGQEAALGDDYGKKNCSKNDWKRVPGGIDFSSDCTTAGMKIATEGQVRGDFTRQYTVTMSSQMTRGDKTTMGKTVITATRLGDCPAGMSPGDKQMTIAGRTITIGADGKPKM